MSNSDQTPIVVSSPHYHTMPSPVPPPPMNYHYEVYRGKSLREYLHILLKRRLWVIGTFLTIFLGVALLTYLRTPIYRSVALLQITPDNFSNILSVNDKASRFASQNEFEKFQQTQYEILHSESLAKRVINSLNLSEYPEFKGIVKNHPNKNTTDIEDLMVQEFLTKLDVSPKKNSFLVEVSYQSSDKAMAQRIVNAIPDAYMNLSIDRRNESFDLVKKWLDKQMQAMADKLQEAQKKLYMFGQKTDIYTLDNKDNVIVQKFIDLSSLLTKAQAEKMAKEAQYQQIKAKGPDAPLIVNNPLVAQLRQQVVAEQAKVSGMRKILRGGHPDLQAELANLAEVKSRLHAEVRRIEQSVKADYEASDRTANLLNDSFKAQKEQMAKFQDNLTHYQILKRDAQTNEQLYQALLSRVKEANIAGTMVPANVAVIDGGSLPKEPYKPKTRRDLFLAGIMGLFMGVALTFLVEHLDDSIKSPDDLERACSLPSLGILPLISNKRQSDLSVKKISGALSLRRYLPRSPRDRSADVDAADMDLIVYKHPKSQLREALEHIYSSMLSISGQLPRAIMVTSPNPSEGKSTIASNLAQSCALNEHQVVLIDCDLRKPRLHQIFQLAPQPGLSDYLTGSATFAEVLHPTGIPNLNIITGGSTPSSPVDLLKSDMLKELLQELGRQFHHIILDTPPVLGFADARFISRVVDGVLLVTKYHSTHKSAGRLAHQLLNQAPILGAVLNSVSAAGQAYGSYYYYYKHYKYYSKYYLNQ